MLLVAAPAPAQDDPGQPAIVVTGVRIQDYRDRLARCLARNCPTNEDADATLALAEALFMDGGYHEARAAVRASLRRNRDAARAFPEPVSDLCRAGARVARHLGLDDEARRFNYNILNALQAGITQEDHRHFTARLEISEALMLAGNLISARRGLMRLAEVARAAGREDVATIAELRILWFESIAEPRGSARGRLIALANDTDPARRLRATGARLLLSRIYRGEGDRAAADALLAQVRRSLAGGPRRRLLYTPAYDLGLREPDPGVDPSAGPIGRNTISRSTHSFEDKWIDVGFWVLPDGHVSGLEILRQGRRADWAAPLLAAIRGRVYSEAPETTYRLERYTYIAPYKFDAGARRWVRSSNARAEYLDLSTGEPPNLANPEPPPPRAPPARPGAG